MKREKRKSERQRSTRYAADPVVPRIRINVLTSTPNPRIAKLARAVHQFERAQAKKARGKMFNCVGCGHRHDGAKCELQYGVGRWDPEKKVLIAPKTRKGILGAAMFHKRRFRPHRNQKTLLTIHIAQAMFDEFAKTGKQPDPSRIVRDAIRAVRGFRQSFSPVRRREVIAGLELEAAGQVV